MNRKNLSVLLVALAFVINGSQSHAQEPSAAERSDYVSDASYIIGVYRPVVGDRSVAEMVSKANQFLGSLNERQRGKAAHKIDSAERRKWTNLPAPANAGGIRLGDLNEKQVRAACDLLAVILSEKGYAKACDIMLADDQLLRGGQPRQGFGTENFSVVVFGTPSKTEPWAVQLDGHHLGLNVSITGDRYSLSPSFIGTQPEVFKISEKRFQPLKGETTLAYQLVASLSDEQKRTAVASPQRSSIRTGPGRDGVIPKPDGLRCAELSEEQQELLVKLVRQWLELQPAKYAAADIDQVRSEMDQTWFTWHGPTEDRSDISYSIQGPSVIIEYACQSLGGNPLDHLHTMYRNPENEYAGQLGR